MKKNIILIGLSVYLAIPLMAQEQQNLDGHFSICLKSVRLDLTSALFINDATLLANIEFYSLRKSSIGIETSLESLSAGDIGGSKHGSPYLDYNLLSYIIFGMGETTNFKITIGYSYRTTRAEFASGFPETQLRYGFTFYWDFLKYFGLNIKYGEGISATEFSTASKGIGISFCWSQ